MAIKILAADKWFSLCIRLRSDWHCDRCGTYYPEGRRQGLHCSHYFSRGSWATRFDPRNAFSHCYGCHQYLGSNPRIFDAWVEETIGASMIRDLIAKKSDLKLGRQNKRNQKEISKHYRAELKRMEETGDRDLVSWI